MPASLLTGAMAALCLFDVDGTLTAPRQVGGAREALGREAEPLQRPDRGDDRPGTGDAGPERGAEEEGAKKALPAGNVQSRKVWV